MQYFYQNHNSSDLIVFFAGWGCDYNQFVNLHDKLDVLILFEYRNLELDFDFSRYHNVYILAYSAGIFLSCLLSDKIPNVRKKIALCGNPYLFDEILGLNAQKLEILKNINLDNYLDFRRQYMTFSDEEFEQYNKLQSLRSIESCANELAYLQKLYDENKDNISPKFDKAFAAKNDLLFDINAQKDFYQNKLTIIANARHHIFFRFNSFEEMI